MRSTASIYRRTESLPVDHTRERRIHGTAHLDLVPGRSLAGNGSAGTGLAANVTTIGLIGSGNIGSTVARLAVEAGHHRGVGNKRGRGAPPGPLEKHRPPGPPGPP